jgi:hypothetical protein
MPNFLFPPLLGDYRAANKKFGIDGLCAFLFEQKTMVHAWVLPSK